MSVRITLIYASLAIITCTFVAFLTGPVWGLRLDYEKGQQLQLIQLVIPTFAAFISSAVIYATSSKSFPEPKGQKRRILVSITNGTLIVFLLGMMAATVMYYLAANGTLEYGRLDFEKYSLTISLLLGFLAASVSGISAYIFALKK